MSKFKVGDKLKVLTDNPWSADLKAGQIVTIKDVTTNDYIVDDGWCLNRKFPMGKYMLYVDKSETSQSGTKHDTGKNRLELIPVEAIEQIGLAFTFGAKKYDDNNWRNGFEWERLRGSTMRHLLAWAKGEDKDQESGLSHLAHLGACVAMLIAHEQLNYGEDNRVKTKTNV